MKNPPCLPTKRSFSYNILRQWSGYSTESTETNFMSYFNRTNLISKAFGEFLGCFIITFIRTVAIDKTLAAIALVIMIHYTANISGGHLNMCVTLTFMLLGHNNPLELIIYWISQLSGAFVGTLLAIGLTPDDTIHCTLPQMEITSWQVFGWEAVCMFIFILPVFSVVWFTQNNSGYGNIGPIIIGLAAYATGEAASPWTGGFLDPARNIASRLLLACGKTSSPFIGQYIGGQFLGAILGSICIIPYYGIAPVHWILDFIPHHVSLIPMDNVELDNSSPLSSSHTILTHSQDNIVYEQDTTQYKCVAFKTLLKNYTVKNTRHLNNLNNFNEYLRTINVVPTSPKSPNKRRSQSIDGGINDTRCTRSVNLPNNNIDDINNINLRNTYSIDQENRNSRYSRAVNDNIRNSRLLRFNDISNIIIEAGSSNAEAGSSIDFKAINDE